MSTDENTEQRILAMKPSDLAGDVMRAVEDLGGEAQRADIIDRALEFGGWAADELAVVSWYSKASRTYHLRTLADYAVTVCRDPPQGIPRRTAIPRRATAFFSRRRRSLWAVSAESETIRTPDSVFASEIERTGRPCPSRTGPDADAA